MNIQSYMFDLTPITLADAKQCYTQGYAVICNDGQAVQLIKE